MAVRIRLSRAGRRHLPYYHIGVFDIRQRREGAWVELLGTYDPINKDESKQISVDTEKAAKWVAAGAVPSETVTSILRKSGVEVPEQQRRKRTRKARPRKGERKVKERTKPRTSKSKGKKKNKGD